MTKSSKRLWLQRLFRDKGILPTPRLQIIFLAMAFPVFFISLLNYGWEAFIAINGILFLLSLFDFLFIPKRNTLTCTRFIDKEAERGQDFHIRVRITNLSKNSVMFRLIDSLPLTFKNPFPMQGKVLGKETVEFTYNTNAPIRGDYELDKLYFRYTSVLGLWEKQTTFYIKDSIKVIPDMTQVKGNYTAAQQLLLQQGEKIKRHHVGSGEFSQTRTYVIGDDPRKINWRQTAKLTELMTNVYEPEHGKHITLLIDCGRLMGIELTKVNRLERAVEAALTVAAVALKKGDYVSVIAFSKDIKAYIPSGKGLGHLQTIIQGIYNLQSDPNESNYAKAFDYLNNVQKRRSLVMLFSDLDPFVLDESPIFYIQRLKRKHLFLLLGISDKTIEGLITLEPNDTKSAMLKGTAQQQMLQRKNAIKKWARYGVQLMEVPEEQLAIEAISRYSEIINRGLL